MEAPTNRLLTIAEVADLIGFKRNKTYQLIASGVLPARRIGRSVRVPLRELERWMAMEAPR